MDKAERTQGGKTYNNTSVALQRYHTGGGYDICWWLPLVLLWEPSLPKQLAHIYLSAVKRSSLCSTLRPLRPFVHWEPRARYPLASPRTLKTNDGPSSIGRVTLSTVALVQDPSTTAEAPVTFKLDKAVCQTTVQPLFPSPASSMCV